MDKPTSIVRVSQVRSPDDLFLNLRSNTGYITAVTNTRNGVIAIVKYYWGGDYTFGVWASEEDYQEFLNRGYEEIWRKHNE